MVTNASNAWTLNPSVVGTLDPHNVCDMMEDFGLMTAKEFRMLENPKTSADILEDMMVNGSDNIIRLAVRHPNTPKHLLRIGLESDDPSINTSACANPQWDKNELPQLLNYYGEKDDNADNQAETVRAIIQHPNFPADTLAQILNDDTQSVLHNVVLRNPSVPEETLQRIISSHEYDSEIVLNAYRNPNLPGEFFHTIIEEYLPNPDGLEVQKLRALTYNPAAPEWFLEKFSDFNDDTVFINIAGNPNVPERVLVKFLDTADLFATAINLALGNTNLTSKYILPTLPEELLYTNISKLLTRDDLNQELWEKLIAAPGLKSYYMDEICEKLASFPDYEGYPVEWIKARNGVKS